MQNIKNPLSFLLFIINHWASFIVLTTIISSFLKFILHSTRKELKETRINLKRLELIQAINLKFDFEIICQLYDEYKKMGGNSYAHELFNEYKERIKNEN